MTINSEFRKSENILEMVFSSMSIFCKAAIKNNLKSLLRKENVQYICPDLYRFLWSIILFPMCIDQNQFLDSMSSVNTIDLTLSPVSPAPAKRTRQGKNVHL